MNGPGSHPGQVTNLTFNTLIMSNAEKAARQDIAKEVQAFYPDNTTWDQFNATANHVFTKAARKLNRQVATI